MTGAMVFGGTLVATTAATVVAPPAAAQLTCDAVWALQGTGNHSIYRADTETGDLIAEYEMDIGNSNANNNGFGISADTRFAFTHRSPNVYVFDTETATTEQFEGVPNGFNATHGAVDPSTGIYYFGNLDTGPGEDTATVYAFDPGTDTLLGQVAEISLGGNAPGANGDWAFDTSGNLYLTAGDDENAIYVARGPLPAAEQDDPVEVKARQIGRATTDEPINGLAVDVQGFVYLGSSNQLFQVNPASGDVVAIQDLRPSGQSVDLASCATPATVMVQKDVVSRRAPTDQFEVSVTGGGIPDDVEGNAGTTEGDDTGIQDETGEVGGPLMVLAGDTYTISESAAGTPDLVNYTTSWQCVNTTDNDAVIAEGAGTEGSFTMPVASGSGIGAAVVCTFTNEDLPQPGLSITKTADPADEVLPGDTVDYTVTIENTGETPYDDANPATFTDDLTGVLDDATFNDDANADVGETTYSEPTLSWSGPLVPGETATITYTVTVDDPPTGDGQLTNAVVGPPESNCDTGTEEDCTVPVPVRALEIVKTSDPIAILPGGTVDYTITVTNTGQVPYTALNPATFTDDLTDVLDDATFNDDADADVGKTTYTEPDLSWEGPLDAGETATITYSVTVDDPPTGDGDGDLVNAVVGPPESNCDTGTEDDCSAVVGVRAFEVAKAVDAGDVVEPGDTLTYTVTVTNTGRAAYTDDDPASFSDDLSDVVDDATFDGDADATAGTVSYSEPILAWTGPLDVGATVTVTYDVTVNDPVSGDGTLANVVTPDEASGGSCLDDDPANCETTTTDEPPADEPPGDEPPGDEPQGLGIPDTGVDVGAAAVVASLLLLAGALGALRTRRTTAR